jgi:hypothetical protein
VARATEDAEVLPHPDTRLGVQPFDIMAMTVRPASGIGDDTTVPAFGQAKLIVWARAVLALPPTVMTVITKTQVAKTSPLLVSPPRYRNPTATHSAPALAYPPTLPARTQRHDHPKRLVVEQRRPDLFKQTLTLRPALNCQLHGSCANLG